MTAVAEPFAHPALFYRDEREYLAGVVPFVRAGLEAGEPVAVAVPGENLRLIEAGLGRDAAAVRLLDMREAGRNPGRIIPAVLCAFADEGAAGRRVRIVGEPVWAGRTPDEYPACAQHEALINTAFRGREVTILCPYDAVRLDERALADARATHPVVLARGSAAAGARSGTLAEQAGTPCAQAGTAYAPDRVLARCNEPLPVVREAVCFAFTAGTLSRARHVAAAEAARLGLAGTRLEDLALTAAELTTNSVVHGGGSGELRVWAAGGHVLCEVRDAGRLDDPLAGRRPAVRGQRGGRGLLLVNLVADLVRVHTGGRGTTVRCWFAH
ncbi:anti-sigma factor RsbA family regulatory protein [Streptomyces sp. NPDC004065]|uniref:anti-sigma factor RsbA family regulatory protein n=1 Tax=Streptomyces sp. NPDC004065 TaxID=3364689 RepID=UPI00384A7BB3